jgi:hypothetical protein
MNKKTKIVLGVAALGAVAYFLFKKSKTTTSFANQIGGNIQPVVMPSSQSTCAGYKYQCPDGKTYCEQNYYNNSIPMEQKFKCPTTSTKASVLTKQQTLQQGRVSGN